MCIYNNFKHHHQSILQAFMLSCNTNPCWHNVITVQSEVWAIPELPKSNWFKKIATPKNTETTEEHAYLQLLLVGCSDDRGQDVWQSFSGQTVQETPELGHCRHRHVQHLNQLQHTRNNANDHCASFGIISVALWPKQDCVCRWEACLGSWPKTYWSKFTKSSQMRH